MVEITIRCDPKDEHMAIEYTTTVIKRWVIPCLIGLGFNPTKFSVKYKTSKGKLHLARRRHVRK